MRGRIVVVNFGSEDLKRTKAALSEEQFEVVPAATPTEALKALDRGVVAGLVLPTILQGMDAERLAAIARHHNHNLLLVFGCTSRIEEDYLKSRFKPPLACLQLPWDRQALSFAVRSGTDQSAAKFSRDSTAVRDSGETHTGNTSDRPFGTLLVELLEAGSTGMLSLANAAVGITGSPSRCTVRRPICKVRPTRAGPGPIPAHAHGPMGPWTGWGLLGPLGSYRPL